MVLCSCHRLYVPAYSPICSCPQSYIFLFAVYFPVRCPTFPRPLSYIFLSTVLHFPVRRCPIFSRPLPFIFPSAALHFPVRCPRCFRALSYTHFPVRCPTCSRPLSFKFPSAVLQVPIRCPICPYPPLCVFLFSVLFRFYLRSLRCYCPRSYKFLTLFRVSLYSVHTSGPLWFCPWFRPCVTARNSPYF